MGDQTLLEQFERRMTRQAQPVYVIMEGVVTDMKLDWQAMYQQLSRVYASVDFEIRSSHASHGETTIYVKFICHPFAAND